MTRIIAHRQHKSMVKAAHADGRDRKKCFRESRGNKAEHNKDKLHVSLATFIR